MVVRPWVEARGRAHGASAWFVANDSAGYLLPDAIIAWWSRQRGPPWQRLVVASASGTLEVFAQPQSGDLAALSLPYEIDEANL